ncbi:MAG TPA: 30S ribosomal protein S6 [Capsulimonadaceae bacterium]|jgi:small subunit ribosomal protein S6
MPETVRFYEVVYVIAPDRTDEQLQAVIEKYTNLITNQGGTVERTDIWERRRLAYEIKGYTEGIYVVSHFRGLPSVEAELKRVFRISEDTLRSIVIRPDEEFVTAEPAPRAYRPESQAPAAVPAPVAPVAAAPEAPVATEEPAPVAAPEVVAEAPAAVEAEAVPAA